MRNVEDSLSKSQIGPEHSESGCGEAQSESGFNDLLLSGGLSTACLTTLNNTTTSLPSDHNQDTLVINGVPGLLDILYRIIHTLPETKVFTLNYVGSSDIRKRITPLTQFLEYFLPIQQDAILKRYSVDNGNSTANQLRIDQIEEMQQELRDVSDSYLLNYARYSFLSYLKGISQPTYIIAIKGDETRFIPIKQRFSEAYSKKVKKRINYLIATRGNQNAVMLTLTLNPDLFKDKIEMWQSIRQQQDRFLKAVRQALNRMGLKIPPYLTTIEAQENGNPHIHIVFFGAKRLMDWRQIAKLWGLGFVFINRTNNSNKVKHPISYVAKYITKTYTTTTDKNLLTQSLVHLFGVRSYTCSRGLIYPLNKPRPLGGYGYELMFLLITPQPLLLSQLFEDQTMGNGG